MHYQQLLLAAAIGSVVGYVTNWLAVKMIFRPRRAVYIRGLRVPFTPGVFARRRAAFSEAIARQVQDRLITGGSLMSAVHDLWDSGHLSSFYRRHVVLGAVVRHYFNSRSARDLEVDMSAVASEIRCTGAVAASVRKAVDGMSGEEVEEMVESVVDAELRAVTWLGVPLGAVIGGSQYLIAASLAAPS